MSDTTTAPTAAEITERVREKYAGAARRVQAGGAGCCGDDCCGDSERSAFGSALYTGADTDALPEEAVRASLGCGNPTALIDLRARRGGARPRLRRRHRRAAQRPPRRPGRLRLRPRHDRRDAGAGPGEQGHVRPDQRRLLEGPDGGDPAARQLASTSSSATASSTWPPTSGSVLERGVPRPQARRPLRRRRRRRRRPAAGRAAPRAWKLGSAAWPARWRSRRTSDCWRGRLRRDRRRDHPPLHRRRVRHRHDPPAGRLGSGRRPSRQRLRPRRPSPSPPPASPSPLPSPPIRLRLLRPGLLLQLAAIGRLGLLPAGDARSNAASRSNYNSSSTTRTTASCPRGSRLRPTCSSTSTTWTVAASPVVA